MQAVIYGRVSTKDQNIESQLLSVRNYCVKNNINLYREYVDEGVSGSKNSRPQLNSMLQHMRDGSFDTILVYKLDRLGRSLKHLLDLLFEFRNRKIRLISVTDNIDTANDSPMNRAFWQLLGVFAELEREMIRERVNDGLEAARKNGKRLGRPRGSKDRRKRSVSGYLLRYVGKTKEKRKLGQRNGKALQEV